MTARALVFQLSVLVAVSGCSRSEAPPPSPPAASPVTGFASPAGSAPQAPALAAPAPVTAAGATAGAPAGPPAIATADGETAGVRLEVTEFKRASGGTVNLKFAMFNGSGKPLSFSYDYGDGGFGATDYNAIGGVHLIDPVGKKKYFVARDSESKCVCSRDVPTIPEGGRVNLWAKFPAPPEDVEKISIMVPHFPPMDDVPLGR